MKYKIILALFILALISSMLLAISERNEELCRDQNICGAVINENNHDSFLGVKNSYIGIFIFMLLLIVTFLHIINPHKHKKLFITLGIILGSIVAIYFLYLQAFVLHEYCKYCLIVDVGILLSLGIILFWRENHKENLSA